jgi:hypothetical protein
VSSPAKWWITAFINWPRQRILPELLAGFLLLIKQFAGNRKIGHIWELAASGPLHQTLHFLDLRLS